MTRPVGWSVRWAARVRVTVGAHLSGRTHAVRRCTVRRCLVRWLCVVGVWFVCAVGEVDGA